MSEGEVDQQKEGEKNVHRLVSLALSISLESGLQRSRQHLKRVRRNNEDDKRACCVGLTLEAGGGQ